MALFLSVTGIIFLFVSPLPECRGEALPVIGIGNRVSGFDVVQRSVSASMPAPARAVNLQAIGDKCGEGSHLENQNRLLIIRDQ